MFNTVTATASSRWITTAEGRLASAAQRLASLRRINSAADDAAGLAISERLAARLGGEQIARRGTLDGLSLAETADGALGEVSSNLQRMRELALQARNGTLNDSDRASLDEEYQSLAEEVNRTIGGTTFNGQAILAGDAGTRLVNTGADVNDTLELSTPDLRSDAALTDATGGSITSSAGAADMLGALDEALESVGQHRARLGATERRLQSAADTAQMRYESMARSYASLTEADVPATTSQWRQAQVQQYAAIALWRQRSDSMGQLLSLFG
jgi:flagellin